MPTSAQVSSGTQAMPAAAKRGATDGLRSSSVVAAITSTPSSRTRSAARSSEAPVDTTSSSSTTVCARLQAGPFHPRPPAVALGLLADGEPGRARQQRDPVGEGVRAHRRSADGVEGLGDDVDDPLAGLAQIRATGDGVLAVDVVVAPAARGEAEGRVAVLVAAGAHQLGEGGSGGVVEGHGVWSLRPGSDRVTPAAGGTPHPVLAPEPAAPVRPSVCRAAATVAGKASAWTIDSIWVARVKAT